MFKIEESIVDIPFEVGETYTTKFQTKEKFTISELVYIHDKISKQPKLDGFKGFYESNPKVICPLVLERLIPRTKIVKIEVEYCENCGKKI